VKVDGGPRFREERRRYGLCFTCEDCAHFAPETEKCGHGYPNDEHRAARYERVGELIVFCKEWELV